MAGYHLQRSLVSEDELDEGPWVPAIVPEDDEVRVSYPVAATPATPPTLPP